MMRRSRFVMTFPLAALLAASGVHAASIEFVTVGDPGNACNPTGGFGCLGAVDYTYQIGKFEVTNAQYAEFLTAVLASGDDPHGIRNGSFEVTRSGSPGSFTYQAAAGREDHPVNFVSYYDSLRFTNWLHNGKPTGGIDASTTEDGAYTFSDTTTVGPRNPGALFFLPTEDEWYKAAYYDALTTTYSNTPFADGAHDGNCRTPPGTDSHSANCSPSGPGDRTPVGAYVTSPSAYGTFDQGGNIEERVEEIGLSWGGHWLVSADNFHSEDAGPGGKSPATEDNTIGFRVAAIPEPGTGLLLAAGLIALARRRRA